MKNLIGFTVTLSVLSIIIFACSNNTPSTLTRSGGASTRCTSNSDCTSGQTCNASWGTCISNTTDLCENVTCNNNQTCNAATGGCVNNAGCISGTIVCSSSQYCEQHTGLAETDSCVAKKANGGTCYIENNGNDCITSTTNYPTCDLDGLCGIYYRDNPGPSCSVHEQCRDLANPPPDHQYCDINGEYGTPMCYAQKDKGRKCKHGYECISGSCPSTKCK